MRVLITDDNVWRAMQLCLAAVPGCGFTYVPLTDRGRILELLPGVDGYVGMRFDEEFAKAVRDGFCLLHVTAAGTDHIAMNLLPDSVTVVNSYGHGRSVAEHVLMVMLAARRGLLWRDGELRAGRWRSRMVDPTAPRFTTLDGTTVGIIGTGHIGTAVAQLCASVGVRVIGVRGREGGSTAEIPPFGWVGGPGALDKLCTEAQYLVIACPLNDRTRHMIGAHQLSLLGADGILVNVGRGGVVDEPALYAALRENTIAGAALDVWQTDASAQPHPASGLPFSDLPNIVMTPHYSASADSTYDRRAEEVVASITAIGQGRVPANAVRLPAVGIAQ